MSDTTFLKTFDGLQSNHVFCLWTGPEAMSPNRIRALWTIFQAVGCPVSFVTQATIEEWIHPDTPLHPAYEFLSATHKSDYLRCYLMHHYGGGYTDIKITTKRWAGFFEQLRGSSKLALGYQEVSHGLPHLEGDMGDLLRANHKSLIGMCAYIFRRRTPFSQAWFDQTQQLLDRKLDALRRHPARHPQDQLGAALPDGQTSAYPLRWSELLGNVMHPLIWQWRDHILQAPIEPHFGGYR